MGGAGLQDGLHCTKVACSYTCPKTTAQADNSTSKTGTAEDQTSIPPQKGVYGKLKRAWDPAQEGPAGEGGVNLGRFSPKGA